LRLWLISTKGSGKNNKATPGRRTPKKNWKSER